MKEILLVPGLILATIALPFLLAGSFYYLAWEFHKQEQGEGVCQQS